MRRPPSPIPSATDRTPPEPLATPSAGGRVQRTVARPARRRCRCRDGSGRGRVRADCATRQPAEHRLRDQKTTAQRQEVRNVLSHNFSESVLLKLSRLVCKVIRVFEIRGAINVLKWKLNISTRYSIYTVSELKTTF